MSSNTIQPNSLQAWILACRPPTLAVSVAPVLVGSAVAFSYGQARLVPILAALFGAILIQIGTNLANDVFDYEKGADNANRLGPTRATQAGLLTPEQVRSGMIVSFLLAALIGVYLTMVGGWPIIVIGLLSIASGIAYTGGPWPLGYNGLGDLFVFVFFGPVAVCGTAYVAHGSFLWASLLASLPLGALATAVLVVNNIRDRETDLAAGKRTMVARFGRRFGVLEYAILLFVAYATLLPFVFFGKVSFWVLLPLLTVPLAKRLLFAIAGEVGAELNPRLGQTARLLLFYSLLFSLGLIL